MSDEEAEGRYAGFAGVEYAYVRRKVYPAFDWQAFETPSPRNTLQRPIDAARVALVGTAGASVRGQPPFSLGADGDASFREIPVDTERIRLSHVGYDVPRARQDPDVAFPLALLRDLAADGFVGELAPRHFSYMGYIPETGPLLSDSAPEVARRLRDDAVDLVLLVPT